MSETMLPRVVSLLDVPDVEKLCRGVINEVFTIRRRGTPLVSRRLSPADHDEALAFLIGEVYVISLAYDPRRQHASSPDRLPSFRHYAYGRLRFRLIDWARSFYGRAGQHRALADPGAAGADRLDDALTESPGDRLDDWGVARGRLVDGRDREAAREARHMGLGPARRAAPGARTPDRGTVLAAGPWVDCAACGWRSYLAGPNGHPGWTEPTECSGCGASLPAREARSPAERPATSRAESEAAA